MSGWAPLIGLTGKAQAGKDTIGQHLVGHHGFTRVSFADQVRAMAYEINPHIVTNTGWTLRLHELVDMWDWPMAQRHDAVREFLQQLGAQVRRSAPDYWIDQVRDFVNEERIFGHPIVITDVRFLNEFAYVIRVGGVVWRVNREAAGLNGDQAKHVSETEMDEFTIIHHTFENNGTIQELEWDVNEQIRNFVYPPAYAPGAVIGGEETP